VLNSSHPIRDGWFLCFTIGVAAALGCLAVAGISLDLFLGSLLLAAILVPALSMEGGGAARVSAVLMGFCLVWLWAVVDGAVSVGAWFSCALVLVSFTLAMVYLGKLLRGFGVHSVAASAIVTLAGLAWLTLPIWMSGSVWIAIHPVFAINAACKELGIWTEQRVAYRLISLGQDTAYRLPSTVFPAVCFHAALAAVFAGLSRIAQKFHRTGVAMSCSI
jgi:hypothetical protein